MSVNVSRRDFVKLSTVATTGLVLGVSLHAKEPIISEVTTHDFGAWVQVDTDNSVTVWVSKSDMGQGIRTSLPMIVAEELDADWKKIKLRQAHFDKKFGNQGTGGSGSIRSMWMPLRRAGAAARTMLVAAAAAKLGVDAAELTVANGVISHQASGKKVTFGEVAEAAAKLEIPKEPKLKEHSQFKIIGKATPRLDDRDIITGKSVYGIDVKVPNMLYASVLRAPAFGAKVTTFDAAKAKAVAGVKDVVKIDASGTDLPWNGVAVIANSTWAAMKGREALEVKWDAGPNAEETTESLRKQMAELSMKAEPVHNVGDVGAALGQAAKRVDAVYELPYLAHATMEPLNATADVRADRAEIWAPTQFPHWAAGVIATALALKPEQVKVNVTLLGGGFGRKANPDFCLEAALLSKAAGAPVKVTWTRADDLQHDYYRPASHHRVEGALDADGNVTGWHHGIAAPAIGAYFGLDPNEKAHDSETGGVIDTPLVVPNFRVDFALAKSGVPRGWWRSVEHSINGFVVNSFWDELAVAAGKDPIEMQLAHLPAGRKVAAEGPRKDFPMDTDRLRNVIQLVREQSGWDKPLPKGRGRGFAAHWSFLSYAAEVAEVSVGDDGTITVHRVVCAVDCGTPLNPDGIRAQVEGGIIYGLTAALGGEITIEGGAVQQSNFHDYPLMTIAQTPKIEVHIVPSTAPPSGIGEPGLPPAAAAVGNAIFNATGKRLRKLPFGTVA
jgi:isoquinoline 1-oxidoreductase beta subunit